jgi:hypothetical protein
MPVCIYNGGLTLSNFPPCALRRKQRMHPISVQRIISFLLLAALGLALNTSALAQAAAKASFCVSDPIARAASPRPERQADCPAGYVNQGSSCKREMDTRPAPSSAPDCPSGYKLNGSSCVRPAVSKPNPAVRAADCPTGYSNYGTACVKLSAPDPLPASRMSCHPGETKVDTQCVKPCAAGLSAAGAACVNPASTLGVEKMSCKAGFQKDDKKARCVAQCSPGYTNSGEACVRAADTLGAESMSCKAGEKSQNGRCVAAVTACAKGEVLQGGACYPGCAPGQDGIGGACWPAAPKSWIACGIGGAKDAQSCAAVVLDRVAMVKHHAVSLARDGNVPAAPGQKVPRLIALHDKFLDLEAAYSSVKDTPQFKRDLAAWSQANQGKEPFIALDDPANPIDEPAMMAHAYQLSAIAGYAGGAGSAGFPKCSTIR